MQKVKRWFDIFNAGKTTVFTIGVVVVAVVNLWLGSKLAPIVDNINSLEHRVDAMEDDIHRTKMECVGLSDSLEKKVDGLDGRFTNLNKRIDTLDDRNLEIYKILLNL